MMLCVTAITLLSCTSSKKYAPSEVSLTAGHARSDTDEVPALDHQGPFAALTVGWTIGPARKTQEEIWSIPPALRGLENVVRKTLTEQEEANRLSTLDIATRAPKYGPAVMPEPKPDTMDRLLAFAKDPIGLVLVALAVLLLALAKRLLPSIHLPFLEKRKKPPAVKP